MAVAEQAVPIANMTRNGPDPTALTTQALERSIANLKELMEVRIGALEEISRKLTTTLDGRPAAVAAEIGHLRSLLEEKLKGVDQQFAGRDTALAAALLAQKTSVDDQNKGNALSTAKTEASFTKQIDGIMTLIYTTAKGMDDKINDIKDRLTTIEARKDGGQSVGLLIFSLIGAAAGVAGVIGLIMLIARGST